MRPFEPGDPGLVGGLWLSGRLGEGPLGVVFLGQQADGTRVAVKLLHAHLTEDPAVWEAYQRAMEELTGLSVPHTARAMSTGLVGARPFLMSEYVEGIPLPDIPEPFSAAELERLAVRTATALAGLHAAGVPHGALRPSNVIMSAQGAVLTDFGLTPDREAALAADPADWARLVQAAAGDQELPPRLRTLTEACLSAVPPSAAELLRQLTAPTSDPGVTVAELAAPPAAFGRPATEPESPAAEPAPGAATGSWEVPPPQPAPGTSWEVPAAFSGPAGETPPASDASWQVPPAPNGSGEIPTTASSASWEIQAAGNNPEGVSPTASSASWDVPLTSNGSGAIPSTASSASWDVPLSPNGSEGVPPGASWEIPAAGNDSGAVPTAASSASWDVQPAASGGGWEVPPVELQAPPYASSGEGVPGQPPAPQNELMATAFDAPLGAPTGNGTAPSPAVDQTMIDSASGAPVPGWGMETRVEPLPMPGVPAGPVNGQAPPVPAGPPVPAFDAPPPWAGERSGGRGAKRPLLVVAASVTVALLLIGVFAMTRGGGEGPPRPVAAKTGVPSTDQPTGTPTEQPTASPSAPVKSQKNAGSPTPKPSKTADPTPETPAKPRKPPRNLLANGGFEGGFGKWQPRSVTFLGAKAAHSGGRAVLLTAGNGYDSAVEYVVTGLKPNTSYQVVGWVTSNAGATFIGAKDFGPTSSYVSSTSKKWTRLAVNFKTGKGTTARIYCWREAPGTGGCDDMALHRR
ncbi:protein kinase domain-containing protein [Actinocorallia populi]|uniref:protein kinase domain-containing protein n=1 Tax=Actinocorallia populi TaxID=2079200 RepID=UPI000D090B2A|nr:carbohydrate binding domain-containing protein [Actinocorallia populi]